MSALCYYVNANFIYKKKKVFLVTNFEFQLSISK